MSKSSKFVALIARLHDMAVVDPHQAIADHRVMVNGRIALNPSMLVRSDDAIRVARPGEPRGAAKLREALERFDIHVAGRIALDLGASYGGFTRTLLEAGAALVYAVDAGFGQLRGDLRQDTRVRNLERTNLGDLDLDQVPDEIDIVTMDLSYLSITRALPQISHLRFGPRAALIALVKPMFELGLPRDPVDDLTLQRAVRVASLACEAAGWKVVDHLRSSVGGSGGAIEFLVHARYGEGGSGDRPRD